jgi:hypothetical protein
MAGRAVPQKRSTDKVYIAENRLAEFELQQLTENRFALGDRRWVSSIQFDELFSRVDDLAPNCSTGHDFLHAILHGNSKEISWRKCIHIVPTGQAEQPAREVDSV